MNNPDNAAVQADARAESLPVAPISEVDLHLHTTASDGLLTPRALVQAAAANGLRTIAITDHDTTDGVAEATASRGRARHRDGDPRCRVEYGPGSGGVPYAGLLR